MQSTAPNLSLLAEHALQLVSDGMVVGLGSGRASTAFIRALGERVRGGLRIRGVPTSEDSVQVANEYSIPLLTLDECESIDLTIDGADEVDPLGNCIKGYGGALVREKIVATASKHLVIVVGKGKLVQRLGERGKLPVEVLPFALAFCVRRFASLGYQGTQRSSEDRPYVTDNGNFIFDLAITALDQLAATELNLRAIPGVVGTGLFLGMANTIFIERDGQVEVRRLR